MFEKPIKSLFTVMIAAMMVFAFTGCGVRPIDPTAESTDNGPTSSQVVRIPDAQEKASTIENGVTSDVLPINDTDLQSIFDVYRLPALERMDAADADQLVNGLQSIKRVKTVGYDLDRLAYPEYWFKATYADIVEKTSFETPESTTKFSGTKASELNGVLSEGAVVSVSSQTIEIDETIKIPSNAKLYGNDCKLVSAGSNKAIEIKDVHDVVVDGFIIEDAGFEYGIFIDNASVFVISSNTISNISDRAIAILHECYDFKVIGNSICDNARGGIFCCGNTHDGIFEQNEILRNQGSANSTPGLFMGHFELVEEGTAKTEFLEPDLDTVSEGPHNIIIYRNTISENLSQGIYSHMGWSNFIVSNTVSYNHKEGTCLDYGTSSTYVSNNSYVGNGFRIGVDDGEPEFNKLPGISLDNACYNILSGNVFARQGGTGIKAVRSSCRNVIIDNTVQDNNQGVSENGHFFGVELASDLSKDYAEAKGMDFTPCYENIVARNTISGAHYSGVYLGEENYSNDVFNNVIMGATDFSIESHSTKFNSIVDNIIDAPEFYDGVILPTPTG